MQISSIRDGQTLLQSAGEMWQFEIDSKESTNNNWEKFCKCYSDPNRLHQYEYENPSCSFGFHIIDTAVSSGVSVLVLNFTYFNFLNEINWPGHGMVKIEMLENKHDVEDMVTKLNDQYLGIINNA